MGAWQLDVDQLIEELPIGILILDPLLFVKNGNTLAFTLLDIPVEDSVRNSIDSLIHDRSIKEALHKVQAGEKLKQHINTEILGVYLACNIDCIPVEGSDDYSILVIIKDTTNSKRVDALKEDFVQTILYHLRAPVTTLKTSLTLVDSIQKNTLPEDLREIISMSRHEVDRLHTIINSLRLLFIIETGIVERDIALETFSVKHVLDRAIKTICKSMSMRCEERIVIEGDERITIMADFEMVKQILIILVKNAICYSRSETSVTIRVSHHDNRVRIIIIDSGIGIPHEQQNKIFTKFYRGAHEGISTVDGCGLGLFLAHSLVEYMKGTLYFESEKDAGTSFYLELPLE